ncbi:beta-channel forming cytolysin CytK2 [Clostridium carnis]
MKKKLIISLISISLISSFSGQVVFANTDSVIPHPTTPISDNHISTTTTVTKDPNGSASTIDTVYNKRVTTYSSTDTISKDGITSTVDATFIHDKNSAEMTTILNLKGFIPSNLTYNLFNTEYKELTYLLWPYKYQVHASTSTPKVKIAETFPKNTIDTSEVNSSISYSLGGGIEVSKEGSKSNINGSVAYSKSISYSQPEYKTVQSINTNNNVKWDITFNQNKEGYSVHDYNTLYGNQLFMVSRYNTAKANNNLTSKDQLSSLMSGGFSPNMGLVLTAPNGTKKSTVKISLGRESLLYQLYWNAQWRGRNLDEEAWNKEYFNKHKNHIDVWSNQKEFIFEIDWENNTIREKN